MALAFLLLGCVEVLGEVLEGLGVGLGLGKGDGGFAEDEEWACGYVGEGLLGGGAHVQ